jgi:hypothetical protein
MDQPMSAVVARLAAGLAIRTGWPVSDITYDAGGAVLTGPGGARLAARKVVVTASLGVLQSGRLRFSPPLPQAKQGALARLRMGNAAKVWRAVRDAHGRAMTVVLRMCAMHPPHTDGRRPGPTHAHTHTHTHTHTHRHTHTRAYTCTADHCCVQPPLLAG